MVAMQAVLLGRWLFLLGCVVVHLRRRRPVASGASCKVSVIVPAYNEETTICRTLRSIAASRRPPSEIIVVDDGSTDRTLALVCTLAAELPTLSTIAFSVNSGKATALNAGLAVASGEVVVTVDADTRLDPQALDLLVTRLVAERAAAVAGNVRVAKRGRWLTAWQSVEYVGALNFERRAQAVLGSIVTVPGAAAAYRAETLRAAGGFSTDTATEDTDLTLMLLSRGERVVLEPRAIAYTETPSDLQALFRQRRRWLFGNLQCAFKHRQNLFSFRHPVLGFLVLPHLYFTRLCVYLLWPVAALWCTRLWMSVGWSILVPVVVALFVVDLVTCWLAHALDGSKGLEHAPLQRLLFPFFLWAVFASVLLSRLRGSKPTWRKPRASESKLGLVTKDSSGGRARAA